MLPHIHPTSDNPNNLIYIFNLSTLHKLASFNIVLDNFAKLHYDYAQTWLHYEWYSKLWTRYHYLKMIGPINDYKLGEIDSRGFVNKLQEIFNFLPAEESRTLLKNAWNSLIVWDTQSSQRLNFLIEKNQFVNLISNSNELHIQKIKQYFDNSTERTCNWQKQTSGECHFQVCENFRLMTSYDNGVFKTDGLLEKWVKQWVSEGHDRECITLVSQYQADLDKAKALGINSQKPNQFFPTITTTPTSASHDKPPIAIASHSDKRSRQNLAKLFHAKGTSNLNNQNQLEDPQASPLLKPTP